MPCEGSKGNTETAGIIAEHLDSLGIPVILGEDLMIRDMGFGVPDIGVRKHTWTIERITIFSSFYAPDEVIEFQ